MEEIWKDIYFIENGIEYDYRGRYQISNLGRIKNLNYMRTRKNKILEPYKNSYGYLMITLYKDNKRKNFMVHRLVAHMFVDGYFDKAEVNHIDEIRDNNVWTNLEWCGHEYNLKYGARIKKQAKKLGRKVIGKSLTETKVIILQSSRQGEKFGFCQSGISACCIGKYKKHKGYSWRYIEEEKELD